MKIVAPELVTPLMVSGPAPVLVMVIVCTALDVDTMVAGKALEPVMDTAGAAAANGTEGESSEVLPFLGPLCARV
jgi:hypothetical protein